MKLIEVSPQTGFRLSLRYDDGVAGVVDLSPLAGLGVFAAWLQPGVFEQVTLSPSGAPEWPGEIDLCPDALFLEITGRQATAMERPGKIEPLA
ncbi:MAG: DUF2442 domain-containing protein [Verrucomicrobia bacterium]|nr:DUF2442 domain-containing protein [Verrucomicrobiota bacterium]